MKRRMETCVLSKLPDCIIDDILQFLPIKDLVRTSVLSTAWRNRWKTVPFLAFKEYFMHFESIIANILAQHEGPIQSFELTPFTYQAKEWVSWWIEMLQEKDIKYLSIENDFGFPFLVDETLFTCDKLNALKLRLGILRPPRTYDNFKHLKDLHLENVTITSEEFREFTSKCPALENLTLIDEDMDSFQVSKNPKLKYLRLQGSFHEVCLENVHGIKIFLLHLSYMVENFVYRWRRGMCSLSTAFATLTGIEKVELWSDSMKYLSLGNVPMKLPSMLNNLKEMFVDMDFSDLDSIAVALALLRSSPNLEKLRIGETLAIRNHNGDIPDEDEFWEKQCQENLNLKNLKFVVMGEVDPVLSNLTKFTQFIHDCAPALKRADFIYMSEARTMFF